MADRQVWCARRRARPDRSESEHHQHLDRHYRPKPVHPAIPIWRGRHGRATGSISICLPKQKIMVDGLRPREKIHGVKKRENSCGRLSNDRGAGVGRHLGNGRRSGLADCAAMPALFYGTWSSLRRCVQKRNGLFRAAEVASIGRTRAQGGRAVFQHGSEMRRRKCPQARPK